MLFDLGSHLIVLLDVIFKGSLVVIEPPHRACMPLLSACDVRS
tara:strand:- start:9 stop:137 length:129 start_codon:yes stop_codon:yes gene_type:complete